ncbi:MAG: bifunctional D-glycero-beta-D-manno-heptose-7-phosphate kinase/D-glycero-beta-D-manno-heptose 1-phosphate adenylyltransferase HldE [Gammaproteobacteria bacterium]|nr:bifunctional D-glycero-beta-D-manno-heptose-7-phosphate kinase/D-glycero-beta-D-manno-heptose 1-phosphate adenylyltransferase HldE [Gammaproteobacteria bacterium]
MHRLQDSKILVVGDVMLDRYWTGSTHRISPEAPVPVVHINADQFILGGAANVAHNIAALGGEVQLLGLCGRDETAAALKDALERAHIKHILVESDFPTITKLRVMSQHQQLIRLDFEVGLHQVDKTPLVKIMKSALKEARCVILSDYNKGTLSDVQALIQCAKAAACPVVIDPKGEHFERYRGAYLLTPNFKEFTAVVGACPDEKTLIDKAHQLMKDIDVDNILVTRGADGMTLIPREGSSIHQNAQAKEVFDVTGAGDTVIAVLGMAVSVGHDLKTAMMLANTAAGIVVSKLGTATVSMNELNRALHEAQAIPTGIVDEKAALQAIEQAHLQGDTVVFTNGCFDLLHQGHVEYLKHAKAQGDRLIVAVNSDASIKRLKGEKRPILPLAERMALIAALGCVDWVISFEDDTPRRLLSLLKPDILVKGGDYSEEEIVGHEIVKGYGGSVRPLKLVPGRSTSNIIAEIVRRYAGTKA